nr:MAG TPA: hypothetical protein [Caudoviricetes sp.]
MKEWNYVLFFLHIISPTSEYCRTLNKAIHTLVQVCSRKCTILI